MAGWDQRELAVVIPLYCEGSHFKQSFAEIRRHLMAVPCKFEIVLVDDGSTDDTWEIVEELARTHEGVSALRLSRNFGKDAALSAGIEKANGDAFLVIDGDLQHPPELVPEMYRLWSQGGIEVVDAVKVSRAKEPLVRRWGAGIFASLVNKLAGFNMSGATDFKLLDRRVVDAWLKMGETQLFYRGMVSWLGFTRAEVPFSVGEGRKKRSGWSNRELIAYAVGALTSFSSAPLHIVTVLGFWLFMIAGILGGRTLYLWFGGAAVTGFSTVILLQLMIGGCVMISLGIIGHYISNIYHEVKRRPRYVIADFIGANNSTGES